MPIILHLDYPSNFPTDLTISRPPNGGWALNLTIRLTCSFHDHLKSATAKAEKKVYGVAILANTVYGLSPTHMQHLPLSCVVTVMTYARPVWWRGLKVQTTSESVFNVPHCDLPAQPFAQHPCKLWNSMPPSRVKLQLKWLLARAALQLNKLPGYS